MTKKFFVLALSVLLTMPCWLHAEEVVIPLMEVTEMGLLPGDNPLDDPDHSPNNPPRPTNFRATIDGTTLQPEASLLTNRLQRPSLNRFPLRVYMPSASTPQVVTLSDNLLYNKLIFN